MKYNRHWPIISALGYPTCRPSLVTVYILNLNLNLIVDGPGSSSAFDVHIVPICVQSRLETVHWGALTTCYGRLFQCGTTRWLKKYFRTCSLALGINSFMLWPLSVLTVGDNWKKVALSTISLPFKIFLSLDEIPVTQASLLMWKQSHPFIIRRDLIPLPSWLPSAGLSPNTRCLWPNMVTKPAHNTPYRTWMNEWFIWYCSIAAGLYSSWKLSLSIFPNLFRIIPNETRKPANNWDNVGLIWPWSCDRLEQWRF